MPGIFDSIVTAATGGMFKGDPNVKELQRVLKAYAEVTGFTAANPGAEDGIVATPTAMAVFAMVPKLPGLPSEVRAVLPVMMVLLATDEGRKRVFDLIKSYAKGITAAIVALNVYNVATGSGTSTSSSPPGQTPATHAIPGGGFWIPPSVITAGTAPAGPSNDAAIWFFDNWKSRYRVAMPRVGLSGFNDYREVDYAGSQPTFGRRVSRMEFMSAIGKWYWTPWGIGGIAVGAVGGTALLFAGLRAAFK